MPRGFVPQAGAIIFSVQKMIKHAFGALTVLFLQEQAPESLAAVKLDLALARRAIPPRAGRFLPLGSAAVLVAGVRAT
jgi:hypothetical protein